MPTYLLASDQVPVPDTQLMEEFCEVRPCSRSELDLFAPKGRFISGRFFKSITISPDYYMPWAMDQFKARGGIFSTQKIQAWNDLILRYVLLNVFMNFICLSRYLLLETKSILSYQKK